jgi:hypothetical protein
MLCCINNPAKQNQDKAGDSSQISANPIQGTLIIVDPEPTTREMY